MEIKGNTITIDDKIYLKNFIIYIFNSSFLWYSKNETKQIPTFYPLKKEKNILNSCSEIYSACFHKTRLDQFCTNEFLERHERVSHLLDSPTKNFAHDKYFAE